MNGIDEVSPQPSENRASAAWSTLVQIGAPIEADMAASADLGFIIEARGGGHSLTVLERRSGDTWLPLFRGAIGHPGNDPDQPGEFQLRYRPVPEPPAELQAEAATGAVAAFGVAVREEGLPSGLRTYARNQGFHLLLDGEWPMQLDAVDRQLSQHPLRGEFRERSSVLATDRTLLFTGGSFAAEKTQAETPYGALWQYDPKVSNWGLRVLLLGAA